MVDAKGTLADSRRTVLTVEKVGRGRGDGSRMEGLRLDRCGQVRTCGIAHRWYCTHWERFKCRSENKPVCFNVSVVNGYRDTAEQVREWPLYCLPPWASLSVLKIKGALSLASAVRAEFSE